MNVRPNILFPMLLLCAASQGVNPSTDEVMGDKKKQSKEEEVQPEKIGAGLMILCNSGSPDAEGGCE